MNAQRPLRGRTVRAVRSRGKHFLLGFDGFSLRIHFLLFGSYRINGDKPTPPRLSLGFSKGESLIVYACSIRFIEGALPPRKLAQLVTQARDYSFDCYRCARRRAFWCESCQRLYGGG